MVVSVIPGYSVSWRFFSSLLWIRQNFQ
jgi:hypothetical protein